MTALIVGIFVALPLLVIAVAWAVVAYITSPDPRDDKFEDLKHD